jgi:hypothetical protein
MQTAPIVLIPPTHELSTPSFHVQEVWFDPFLKFLNTRSVHVTEEPGNLGCLGPHGVQLREIRVEAGTPMPRLETVLRDFLTEPHAQGTTGARANS